MPVCRLGADHLTFEGGGDLLLAGNFFSGIGYVQDFFPIPSPCTIFLPLSFAAFFFSIAYTI
jgi:hypothetical protein